MSLIPRWQNRLPSNRQAGDLFNLGQLFENLEQELQAISPSHTGLSISSDEQSIYIEANVPGLTAKDVDVSIDNNCLWIKGEKKAEEKDKKKKYYRQSQLSFSYCIPLWEEIDKNSDPEAVCKDGVMKVTFPKVKEKQTEAKKIQVK
jgi:HSP20 family protein